MAPSAAMGSRPNGLVKNKSTATIMAAAVKPATWRLPPIAWLTAVREPAALTGPLGSLSQEAMLPFLKARHRDRENEQRKLRVERAMVVDQP